jgi:hypothetical protein
MTVIKLNPISVASEQHSTPVNNVVKLGGAGETETIPQPTAGGNNVERTATESGTFTGALADPIDAILTTENSAAQVSTLAQLESSTGSQDFVNSISPTNPASDATTIKSNAVSTDTSSASSISTSLDTTTLATTSTNSNVASTNNNSTAATVNSPAATTNSTYTTVNSTPASTTTTTTTPPPAILAPGVRLLADLFYIFHLLFL